MSTRFQNLTRPDIATAVCVAVSIGLILGAHGFERIGGLPPCLLCLDQREAHWAAIATGGLALLFSMRFDASMRLLGATLGVLVLLYLFSAGLAGYHAGVEWGFWPGPNACAPAIGGALPAGDELLASLSEGAPAPSCSEAAWRMAGISMAGYNALISLGLAALAALSSLRIARNLRRDSVGPAAIGERL